MNRIRRVGNSFQCLITPYQKYNTGIEHILGFWTDETMMGFEVKTFNNYQDAECEIYDLPNIDWDALVIHHTECFRFLRDQIKNTLERTNIACEFKHNLATPEQVKTRMFNRVLKGQIMTENKQNSNGFRTVHDMNDIISFTIINPWTQNINELVKWLIKTERLNIIYKIEKHNTIKLIGRTEIGTTYEIILFTSLIYNWNQWRELNPTISGNRLSSSLINCIKTQKVIDSSHVLR
jgi:hypothetical protein